MTELRSTTPPSPPRSSGWVRVVTGLRKHGFSLAGEVLIFWATLLGFELLYGGRLGRLELVPLGLVLVAVAMGAGEARFRLYRRVWAVAGIHDAIAVGLAVSEAALLLAAANALIPAAERPFRLVVPILAAPALAAAIGAYRLLPRLLSSAPRPADNRLLLVLFDPGSLPTLKTLLQHPNPNWSPVGIVTSVREFVGRTVLGVPVVGLDQDLKHWMEVTRADGVAFVVPDDRDLDPRALYSVCLAAGRPIFVVPGPDEWFQGAGAPRMKQLSADDLVGRSIRQLDVEAAAGLVAGKTLLVTGAAGSIGSELCRILAGQRPQRLVLLDVNESGLFDLSEELRIVRSLDVREALVSITDLESLRSVFAEERPDIVFHAAAYKHVPMLEAHPRQAYLTNVAGTRNVMRCADAAGVKNFVLVSTDKAVARHSVMGCTKRICELMILTYAGAMGCWAVRFGNVVGSRGSVVPIFERQIEQGGPVTITHPDMTRYMMTIREAAALVVISLGIGRPGHVYMLDMGEPIKILSLAEALMRARGYRPGRDVEVVFTGLRPGERVTEDLLAPDEGWRPTAHASIHEVISPTQVDQETLEWTLGRLDELALEGRSDELVRQLKQVVLGKVARVEEPEARRARPRSPRPPAGD